MKELKELEKVYLKEYDVYVNKYLTYAQIQAIAKAVAQFNTWSERSQNIDMLVLALATDIGEDNVNNIDHDLFLSSGLIKRVRQSIVNYGDIAEAVAYGDSVAHVLKDLSKTLTQNEGKIKEILAKYNQLKS